jgi:hypothetical protein
MYTYRVGLARLLPVGLSGRELAWRLEPDLMGDRAPTCYDFGDTRKKSAVQTQQRFWTLTSAENGMATDLL